MMQLLETAERLAWSRVPHLIDHYVEKCAAPARDIRRAVSQLYCCGDVGLYWNPVDDRAGVLYRGPAEKLAQETAWVKTAIERLTGEETAGLTLQDLVAGPWVKVAVAPTVRRIGELLNFFPGHYPGGIPNAPSPLAATLSGGLVGAGLGYGLGWAGEHFLPESWHRGNLRKTFATAGGLAGATPGAMWSLAARLQGRSLMDGSVLAPEPGSVPQLDLPLNTVDDGPYGGKMAEDFVKRAFDSSADSPDGSGIAIDVNRLGQVLWEADVDPSMTATTLGAVYAAGRLPGGSGSPRYVTPQQTGVLGSLMGAAGGGAAGYATGWLVGKALGLLTGMPAGTQNVLKNTGAIVGIVDAVVPRLFH